MRLFKRVDCVCCCVRLSELHELVQTVIAEHIVQAFLLGDEESLRLVS